MDPVDTRNALHELESRSIAAHRRAIAADLDALHGVLIASLCCVLSAGLVFAWYLWRALRIARRAGVEVISSDAGMVLLLFGKHSPGGRPDADFQCRIDRALQLANEPRPLRLLLLGGGPPPSEAEVARSALISGGLPDRVSVELEDQSYDTLQNLRHARRLLGAEHPPVVLLSNRYHLARCSLLADGLQFEHRLCAAESHWRWRDSGKLLLEALYCMWIDIGRRWARLIGHRRMLAKVS